MFLTYNYYLCRKYINEENRERLRIQRIRASLATWLMSYIPMLDEASRP